jgi:hypothetical protein
MRQGFTTLDGFDIIAQLSNIVALVVIIGRYSKRISHAFCNFKKEKHFTDKGSISAGWRVTIGEIVTKLSTRGHEYY